MQKKQINQIEVMKAITIHSNGMNLLIDIRYIRETKKSGRILGAKHVPRGGMLEFCIDTHSLYHKGFFNEYINFIFYYASYLRSTIASHTANNLRLLNTFHLLGGYNKWLRLDSLIEKNRVIS